METPIVKLELPLDVVNVIMESLGNMPYVRVVNVIETLKNQTIPQVQKQEQKQAQG